MDTDQAAEGSSQQTQTRLEHLTHHLDREQRTSATPDTAAVRIFATAVSVLSSFFATLQNRAILFLTLISVFSKRNSKSSFLSSCAEDFIPCSYTLTKKIFRLSLFTSAHLSSEGEAALRLAALNKCSSREQSLQADRKKWFHRCNKKKSSVILLLLFYIIHKLRQADVPQSQIPINPWSMWLLWSHDPPTGSGFSGLGRAAGCCRPCR